VNNYIDRHIKRALEAEAAGEGEKADPNPSRTTRRYVLVNELVKHIKNPIKLRSQSLNFFIPGRDTTPVLVANCLFHVARNLEIWTQLRKDAIVIGDTPLTFETLKSLHSFRHVLYETLRLQGPADRVQRLALRDMVLAHGGGHDGKSAVLVRKGDVVALNLWGPNHDRDVWWNDVGEFKPPRFIGLKMGWEFTPFLGGLRICRAEQQGLT
jgi:cytochrome P450 monooxygenase